MAIESRSKTRAEDAIKHYIEELLRILPLDNKVFFARVYQADLLPTGTGDIVDQYETRAKKVSYFLHSIVIPGADVHLPKLIKVMKKCDECRAKFRR